MHFVASSIRSLTRTLAAAGAIPLVMLSIAPQTGSADSPTALQNGANTGSADSFQGPHDWYFQGKPGSFDLAITSLGQGMDSVPLDGKFQYKIFCYPHIAPHAYLYKSTPDGFTFHGSLAKNTKVVVRIIPATSTLVRVAQNYSIEATGSAVSFDAASSVDPIVGTYMDKSLGHGATHFVKDGSIAFADGSQGTWVLFDRDLRIYTVTVGSNRKSLKFVPGRGLIDQANGLSAFDSIR